MLRAYFLRPGLAMSFVSLFASSAFAAPPSVPLPAYPSALNLPAAPLSAYPRLSASDFACAQLVGGYGISYPALGQVHTPATLGVVCGVTTARMVDQSYLSALFVAYVDAHRNAMGRYCPAPYDASGNYNAALLPGAICAF